MPAAQAYLLATFALAAVAAVFDWRVGRIPNSLTLGAILLAVPIHAVLSAPGHTWDGVESSLLGAGLCALPFVLGWRFGWIAAGDAKLVGAIGALAGISSGLESVFLGLFCAGAYAFLRLCWDGAVLRMLANGVAVLATRTVIRNRFVEPAVEFTSTLRFGPFAMMGAGICFILTRGLH